MNSRKPASRKFSGPLAIPLLLPERPSAPTLLTSAPPGVYEKAVKHWEESNELVIAQNILKKLQLLLECYGINKDDTDCYFLLSIRLAVDHVPGFQVSARKPAGRREHWHFVRLMLLWWDIEQIRKGKRITITNACKILVDKHERWKSRATKTKAVEQLRQQYAVACKTPWVAGNKAVIADMGWDKFSECMAGSDWDKVLADFDSLNDK